MKMKIMPTKYLILNIRNKREKENNNYYCHIAPFLRYNKRLSKQNVLRSQM